MKKLLLLALCISAPCLSATYTANYNSTITWVKIYNDNTIYFGTAGMPTDDQCTGTFFALDPSLTDQQRSRYYSMLMTAQLTGTSVTVGYDNTTANCLSTRPIAMALSFGG